MVFKKLLQWFSEDSKKKSLYRNYKKMGATDEEAFKLAEETYKVIPEEHGGAVPDNSKKVIEETLKEVETKKSDFMTIMDKELNVLTSEKWNNLNEQEQQDLQDKSLIEWGHFYGILKKNHKKYDGEYFDNYHVKDSLLTYMRQVHGLVKWNRANIDEVIAHPIFKKGLEKAN